MFHNKLKAFTVHLAISVIIVTLLISSIIYFWYPLDYLAITSFKEIALLIVSIDLVVGPILTFVVYNKNKKSLRFDLTVIAILQLSALTYGTYFLYKGHPVFLTYAKGSFTLVNAELATPEKSKFEEYKINKLSSVKLAYAEIPKDAESKNKLLEESLKGGADLEERAEYYKPYNQHVSEIIANGLDINKVLTNKKLIAASPFILNKLKENANDFVLLPLEGSTGDAIIVLDRETAEPLTTLDIDPWELTKK